VNAVAMKIDELEGYAIALFPDLKKIVIFSFHELS